MIHLITGNPGAKKTAYCVSLLDKVENTNKVNIVKNAKIYKHNLDILTQKSLLDELTYFINPVGTGETLINEIEPLDNDYFEFLGRDNFDLLRPNDYFKRSTRFNNIIERITERQGNIGLEYFLPVRTIYTNIEALRIDYVRALVPDWRECPDGSIIVIDEIQLVYPYSETKDKTNPIVTELSIHRHRGFDFYFITQSAGNLHVLIKDLVAVHYHVTCPFGWKTKIFQYGEFKANPNAISVKMSAEQSFYFTPPDYIFKLYKSTTINTAKARPPYKAIAFVLTIMTIGLTALFYAIFSDGNITDTAKKFDESTPNQVDSVIQNTKAVTTPETTTPSTEQNEPINQEVLNYLTKDELIEYVKTREKHAKNELEKYKLQVEQERLQIAMQYETLQKQLLDHDKQIKDFYARLEMYKTMLPKNYEIIKNDPNLQVRAVVKMRGKCNAYNAHGDLMNLSPEQCDYYLQETGRVQKGSLSGNGSSSVARLETKPVADILADNPDAYKQPPSAPPKTNEQAVQIPPDPSKGS